jgi:hypothetical protein
MLAGELAAWIASNYSALRDSLERNQGAKSAGLWEGAPTNLVVQGESVWMSIVFTVNRTLPAECWACVGSDEFVKAQHDRFNSEWEQWTLAEGHTALKTRREEM